MLDYIIFGFLVLAVSVLIICINIQRKKGPPEPPRKLTWFEIKVGIVQALIEAFLEI